MHRSSRALAPHKGFQEHRPSLLSAFTQAPLKLYHWWVDGTLTSIIEDGGQATAHLDILSKHYRDAFSESPDFLLCIERAFRGEAVTTTVMLSGVPWDARFFPSKDETGNVRGVVSLLTDASERMVAFRQLGTLDILAWVSRCLARADSENDFLQEICSGIQQNHAAAWIGLVNRSDSSKRLTVVTAQGPAHEFLQAQVLAWDASSKSGQHIAGEAVRTGKTQVANQLLESKECSPWHEAARRLGWQSALAVPLLSDAATIGVLVLFSSEPFQSAEQTLWEQIADEIREGVATLRERADQKQVAAARRSVEENYQRLVEAAFDVIIIHENGKIIEINPAGVNRVGASHRDELIGAPLLALVDPHDREYVRNALIAPAPSSAHGEARHVEFRLLGLDSTQTDVEGNTVAIEHAGKPAQLSVLRDVTDRKRQEKALNEAKRSLDTAQRVACMGSADLDLASGSTIWSENAFNILGLDAATTLAAPEAPSFLDAFSTVTDSVGMDRLRELLEEIRIKGMPATAELKIRRSQTFRTMEVHGRPTSPDQKAVSRIFFLLKDVSEFKLIERGLRETTQQLRKAQEIGRMGDFQIDMATKQLSLSLAASTLLELAMQTPVTLESFFQRFSEADGGDVRTKLLALLDGERDAMSEDARLIHRERWVSIEASRDNQAGIIGIIRDVTERKRVELALRQSENRLRHAQKIARAWEFIWNVPADEITWSDTLTDVLGIKLPMKTLKFGTLIATMREVDREAFKIAANRTVKDGVPGEVEYIQTLYEGKSVQVFSRWEVSRRDADGRVIEISGITQDITSLRAIQERVSHRERFHQKSGLPNKGVAYDRFAYLVSCVDSDPSGFGVIGLRVLDYKRLRDVVPEAAFYQALRRSVEGTRRLVPTLDLVARLERGQFICLVRGMKPSAMEEAAMQMRSAWSDAFSQLTSGETIKVATWCVKVPEEGTDVDDIFRVVLHRLADQ